jgi:hypothetical protein
MAPIQGLMKMGAYGELLWAIAGCCVAVGARGDRPDPFICAYFSGGLGSRAASAPLAPSEMFNDQFQALPQT